MRARLVGDDLGDFVRRVNVYREAFTQVEDGGYMVGVVMDYGLARYRPVFFKEIEDNDWRISLRSKGSVDVNAVASEFGGGGHKNASGCGAIGRFDELKVVFQRRLVEQIDSSRGTSSVV
jgi:phosphoesterase RecJ-like protein